MSTPRVESWVRGEYKFGPCERHPAGFKIEGYYETLAAAEADLEKQKAEPGFEGWQIWEERHTLLSEGGAAAGGVP